MNTHSTVHEGCIPNIGPQEQRMRLRAAWLAFGLALVALVALLAVGAPREWRLLLFLPIAGGAISYCQVRDKTCIALAAAGTRSLHGQVERVENPHLLARMRRQAMWVYLKGLAAAVAITALLVALPPW